MQKIKIFLFNILCNNLSGYFISILLGNFIPDLRWRKFRFFVEKKYVNKKLIASIFLGFYESAEIRYIEKYLRNDIDVLELGGSIGIVSAHISSKLNKDQILITVEANPYLINNVQTNIIRHKTEGLIFHVLNYAISYNVKIVYLNITSNNTETKVIKDPDGINSGINVEAKTVSDILKKFHRNDFAMVCDIEGSEIEILLNEQEGLKNCCQLFIEFHEVFYNKRLYTINEQRAIVEQVHNFKYVTNDGPVYYFSK